ncbi:MAG: hypothetical protein U0641_07525 [Anaerolineae bacterium]
MESEAVPDKEDDDGNLLVDSPRFQAMLEKSRRSIRETGALSGDEIWDDVDGDEVSDTKN